MSLDSWKVEAAISSSALSGNAAAAGLIALCGELVAARVLSFEAADRIRDAMLIDVETAQAPLRAKQVAREALSALCVGYFGPMPPPQGATIQQIAAE